MSRQFINKISLYAEPSERWATQNMAKRTWLSKLFAVFAPPEKKTKYKTKIRYLL